MEKSKLTFSLDLLCAECYDTKSPIKYDKNTNAWWHKCGWVEKATKVTV